MDRADPAGRAHRDPWASSYHNGALLHLDVADDGTASGRFGGNVSFMWLFDPATGSRASVTIAPQATEFPIGQHGPRRLWDEAQVAYDWWVGVRTSRLPPFRPHRHPRRWPACLAGLTPAPAPRPPKGTVIP